MAVFGFLKAPSDRDPLPPDVWAGLVEQAPTVATIADLSSPVVEPLGTAIDFIVRRNDTLERIFRQSQLNLEDLATIRTLPGVKEHVDSLKPGELLKLVHLDGSLQSLVRRLTDTTLLSVVRDDTGFSAQVVETPLELRRMQARGVIDSSLFVSGRAAGVSADIILRMANDIFGWDIDFALDIRRGDSFAIVYEQRFRDGEYLGDGRILAAEFINEGHTYRAVRYDSNDGEVGDYFAPDGKSMRKRFLRAPVEFKYISSNFNPRRFHPVLKITRAHQGVDYAAPTGTPIRAAGDGRVSFLGVKGGYGKAVILEHGGNISTLYGHMSRHVSGMRGGARVKQGDIVGFVGQTGTASGPHLHYEYRVGGVHKNPRTVPLPDALPISSTYIESFQQATGPLLTELDHMAMERVTISASK
jgi:murein DD-endopeptidase MepM/ murein hydrolase activator NlpD